LQGHESIVENIVARLGSHRYRLMKILQEIQKHYGYLPREALIELSVKMNIPLSDILNVATFYHQYKLHPPGLFRILVCMGTACHLKGNEDNYKFLVETLGVKPGEEISSDGLFSVEKVRCFGCCGLAPVVMVTSRDGSYSRLYGYVNPPLLRRIIAEHKRMAKR